jgi:pimeloyl-ACP methyl ester carboxylesterase
MFRSLTVAMTVVGVVAAASGAAARPSDSISWAPCAGSPSASCATLTVPLDWAHPRGATLDLAVARHPAEDPARRIGTLFFNPGGPGDSAADYVKDADAFFPADLRARFDIVGLDPRGFGSNEPIRCRVPVLTPDGTLFPRTQAQFDKMVRNNRAIADSCVAESGDMVRHLDTISVARDHDALRRALGERQVSWLGLSYGTQLAADYAELFPGRTRAMVLDAALDHSLPEVYQVATEAASAEESLNRFIAWCATDATCALRGQDVGAVFDRLVAGADRHPIPVEGAIRAVTGEDIRMETKGKLRFKEPAIFGDGLSWAGLSRALRDAVAGDAAAFAVPAGVPQNGMWGLLANACMDYVPQVHTWAEMQQRLTLGKTVAPHLQGASETWQALYCIGWPFPATNPPRALHVTNTPALMVHAEHDSSDPYLWAHGLAAQIDGIDLVTRAGDGHTSWYTSACARAATVAFLIRPGGTPADRACTE